MTTTQNIAVKYRPKNLDEIVGQEETVERVQAMQESGNWPSAILLDGGTGTGKTTFARIISMMLNCQKGNICGKCASCKSGKANPDIEHIDAAVSGKVDDIRSLVNRTMVAPMHKRRVFIIDECHMLTGAAANALLMTLEEPPSSVVFILCTTDPDKLLPTIRGRCVRLQMKPVPVKLLVRRMTTVMKKEGVKFNKEDVKPALKRIAEVSEGSVRNALSILESVMHSKMTADAIDAAFKKVDSNANVYEAAALTVSHFLADDLEETIKHLRSVDQRSMIYELQNMLDNVLGSLCGYSNVRTYSMRVLGDELRKNKIKPDTRKLAALLCAVSDIKWDSLTKTSLMTAVLKVMQNATS